jgi:hypothetical protein
VKPTNCQQKGERRIRGSAGTAVKNQDVTNVTADDKEGADRLFTGTPDSNQQEQRGDDGITRKLGIRKTPRM